MASKSTDAAWRRSLRAASFRGVGFKVDTSDRETGRRAVTHEFPGRDVPYTEDLGRKARSYGVEAYVLGPDYMPARDALLKACEEEGPGRLVTPWAGEVLVVCTGCRVRESKSGGGMATFSLTFSEAGEAASPSGSAKPGAQAGLRADNALDEADADVNRRVRLKGQPHPVLAATMKVAREVAVSAQQGATAGATPEGWADHVDMVTSMLPEEIAEWLPSSLLRPLIAYAVRDDLTGAGHTRRANDMLFLAASTPTVTVPEGAGTMRTTAAENAQAIADYQRRAATAEAARSAALSAPASRADAATLREGVTDAVDAVLDGATDDGVYASFTDLQAATVKALTDSAGSAPDVVTVRQSTVAPSLVVAHRTVADRDAPDVETEILARNRVRHPGFVPPGQLEVLRNA